jgi:HNH endonuclease
VWTAGVTGTWMLQPCRLVFIYPLLLSFNVLQKKYAGNVWAIINTFKTIDILGELNGPNIHRLENGFTMDVSLHDSFDDLRLWFEHMTVSG